MLTFPQYYSQELRSYRKQLSPEYRRILCRNSAALAQFRDNCWEDWEKSLEIAIRSGEQVKPAVLDSWIRTVTGFHKGDSEYAESGFLRHFRGVLEYTKACPGYLTPLARKFHKEHAA